MSYARAAVEYDHRERAQRPVSCEGADALDQGVSGAEYSVARRQGGQVTIHPPRLASWDQRPVHHHAAGFTTSGPSAAGWLCDLNGPTTLRALVHSPIRSALVLNRYRINRRATNSRSFRRIRASAWLDGGHQTGPLCRAYERPCPAVSNSYAYACIFRMIWRAIRAAHWKNAHDSVPYLSRRGLWHPRPAPQQPG